VSAAAPPTTRANAFLGELLAWLNSRFAPDGPAITRDTPLFAGGLLDSLRILELIAWTERAIGHEIPDRAIRTDNFASAARIAELFAAGGPDAHR
jgi:acyl carrier protein